MTLQLFPDVAQNSVNNMIQYITNGDYTNSEFHRIIEDFMIQGGCPEGTDWLTAAKRELKEETGFEAGTWTEILQMHVSNSVSDEFAIVYVAQDLIAGEAEPEDTEDLKVIKMPFSEAVNWVMDGKITDSISVAAILKWELLKNKKE